MFFCYPVNFQNIYVHKKEKAKKSEYITLFANKKLFRLGHKLKSILFGHTHKRKKLKKKLFCHII